MLIQAVVLARACGGMLLMQYDDDIDPKIL